MQRTDFECDARDGKPRPDQYSSDKYMIAHCAVDPSNGDYTIEWKDGFRSQFSSEWVMDHLERLNRKPRSKNRKPWSHLTEEQVRNSDMSLSFDDVIQDSTQALKSLYTHGILLVTGTPISNSAPSIAALAAALGGGVEKSPSSSLLPTYHSGQRDTVILSDGTDGPLRTLYGTVWSTRAASQTAGASTADSAYGNDALPLHTDMTYHTHPPGLQIFTMVHPAKQGGESIFGDGLYCAEELRRNHPAAFATLSTVPRRYRCVDRTNGWHLEATGPVITVDRSNAISAIRHNDLDRLPDWLPPDSNDTITYENLIDAHTAWDAILARDETRLVMRLQPGDTMVVANQRCFHGRCSFEATRDAPRTVMGCYVCQDELDSRWRMLNFQDA